MFKIIVLTMTSFALSACGAIPAAPGTEAGSQGDAATAASGVQVATNETGLGTVAYDDQNRAKNCEKVRKTGSHQYISRCDDPDGGSQPVRYGTWNDLGRLVMSGTVRPENY